MTYMLPPMRLTGADVLRDGALQRRSVAIAEGRITRGPLPEVDLTGYLVLPGIIDLHGDAFERHIIPRPSAQFPLLRGLASADRDAAANGVTTAYFAQGWSWEGAHRSPGAAARVLSALEDYRPRMLTDIRVQIRCETHLVESGPALIDLVHRYGVDFVVFNDHIEQALEMQRTAPAEFAGWARKLGRTPQEQLAEIEQAAARSREVPRHLCRLAEAFDEAGVLYGSHDDPDGETRERFSMIGARIAEFPTTRRAAAAAHAMMSPVLLGAPNVVRGGSHTGNVSARDLIAEGLCDALVSDYYYPALAEAAFALAESGILDFPRAWALISSRPAEIMRLPDRGLIEPGRRADLTIVNAESRTVEATISGGRMTYLAGEVAGRFLQAPASAMSVAAE